MNQPSITRRSFLAGAIGLPLALGGLSLVGCANANPLIGKWTASNDTNHPIEFYEDGTFSYTNSYIPELGHLKGKWYAYKNNPINVNGTKWYAYTTDSPMGTMGKGEVSEDIGGEYQEGRNDFLVNGDLMYGTVGFYLARDNKFNEDAISKFVTDGPGDFSFGTFKREKA